MGLDITVYADLKPVSLPDDEGGWEAGYIHIYRNDYFESQADNLETGWYEGESAMSFRAGSYSGYNSWREQLCQMALGVEPDAVWNALQTNPDDPEFKGKPFVELINFADNEGTIGPQTSAKLYLDFVAFDEMARQNYPEEDNWFYEKYKDWTQAFKIASEQNGAVSFH